MRHTETWNFVLACSILLTTSCGDPGAADSGGPSLCINGEFCLGELVCVGGFCIAPGSTESSGDGDSGDGDGDSGDGDGDSGDGDPGDGDGDSGDGDGDGDGDSGDGDGDGDLPQECGNGVVEGDELCDDGNANNDVCTSDCEWGPQVKLVFVTSEIYTADFGGMLGADANCQSLADAAGLPGNYFAWLSTESISPSTRFTKSANPYVLVTGAKIADDWADLTDETLDHPIDTDQWGDPSPESEWIDCVGVTRVAFTATHASGEQAAGQCCSCLNWNTTDPYNVGVGRTTLSNAGWTQGCSGPYCGYLAALYCFQQ